MSDIVVSEAKKINILDKIIQNVVIMVNMSKMNRAIDEHLEVIKTTERDDQKQYQENILREIVYVKYQYDIMQRTMYELKLSYPNNVVDNINSVDKIERLNLQKEFLEMEYDRISKNKFKNKENVKYMLIIISSVIQTIKQDIKDEGKQQKYNAIMKCAEEIETKMMEGTYTETCYTQFFDYLKGYVNYINDNYDISKLPTDEKEIIELVIESTIKGMDSDVDILNYEFSLVVNICKNAYRYLKIVDKVFSKLQRVFDQSLERGSINISDYIEFYKEIYDQKIKIMVNDVHRTIKMEDEYLDYSRQLHEDEGIDEFIIERALETVESEVIKEKLQEELDKYRQLDEENNQEDNLEENMVEELYNVENNASVIQRSEEKANV